MIKYLAYCRKSTDEKHKQVLSIKSQAEELKEFAKREKLEIVDWITESKTAKSPGRKGFNQLLQLIKEGKANGILSWHPDRLARNSIDGGKLIYLLDTGKLKTLKFPTFWFENTPQGRFMLSLAFSQAKYYVDSLSENVTRGMTQKAKRGEFPGKATFGYLNDRNTKKVVLNPTTAPVVKQALIMFSQGQLTLGTVGHYLYQKGVMNHSGNRLWSSQVHRIITSPFYYGAFTWNGQLYPGNHPPLITKKVFDKNQSILKQSLHGKFKRNQKVFVFKGLIKCGECHHPLTAENHTKHYKNGTAQTFTYYRCTKADRIINCSQRYINQPELVKQVNNYITGFIWPKSLIDQTFKTIDGLRQSQLKTQLHQLKSAKEQVNQLDQQINRLIDLRLKGILTDEELLFKKNELTAKKLSLKPKSGQNPFQPDDSFEPIETMFKNLAAAKKIRDDDVNLTKKAQWLQMTASNLFLEDKILRITREKPWARLTPRPTIRKIVTLIQHLRTDAENGLLGNLPRLYSTIDSDSSRDIAPAGDRR